MSVCVGDSESVIVVMCVCVLVNVCVARLRCVFFDLPVCVFESEWCL